MSISNPKGAMDEPRRRGRISVLIDKLVRLVKPQGRRPLPHHEPHARRFEIMADQEEDFSSLPLPDRFTHKV